MRVLDLGALQIQIGQDRIPPIGRRPSAVLNTLLLHLNRRVPVDLLLDAVWGDQATASSVPPPAGQARRRPATPGTRAQERTHTPQHSLALAVLALGREADSAVTHWPALRASHSLALDVTGGNAHLSMSWQSRAARYPRPISRASRSGTAG